MPTNISIRELRPIGEALALAKSDIVTSGKAAFDAIDPQTARLQADKLDKIEAAERLLCELQDALLDLGLRIPAEPIAPRHVVTPHNNARLPDGPALHPNRLREPTLAALREAAGPVHLRKLYSLIEPKIAHLIRRQDLEPMKSPPHHPRWQYNVQWTLTVLKNEGLIANVKPHSGMWRIV